MASILLVEDDETLAGYVSQWLSLKKHAVEIAATGPEALEQMRFANFDIIIMDWHLPGMDGIDVCRQYRALGGQAPIIMLSGNRDPGHRKAGLEAGANEYLVKPYNFNDLSAKIDKLIAVQS